MAMEDDDKNHKVLVGITLESAISKWIGITLSFFLAHLALIEVCLRYCMLSFIHDMSIHLSLSST